MARCDAEMCPYWDGHGCPCEEFGIDRPGPGADPFGLPSATYERVEYDEDDEDEGDEYDGDEEPLPCELDSDDGGVCQRPLVRDRCPVHSVGQDGADRG